MVHRRPLECPEEQREGLRSRNLASHAMRTQQMKRCLEGCKFLSFKGGLGIGKCWKEWGSRD